jgi:ABC-2 type transport system ATP-binding protein
MTKVLEINKVSKSFKDKNILKNISLDIKEGEIFGLIGINGIGKTTLIKIILDLLKSDEGISKIFSINSSDKASREKLAYLPEKFQPSSYLKGREFLSIAMSHFGKSYNKDEAESLAKKLDLDVKALDHTIGKYSKGMGQKLGLISIFMSKTPLFILDEPMSGLDPHVRIMLKDMLTQTVKGNKNTVFFSSHILSDIEEICNRIGVLHQGELIFVGKASEFKEKFKAKTLERAFLQAIGKSATA